MSDRGDAVAGLPDGDGVLHPGLARAGATVIGVGDQPPHDLPDAARHALAHYEHVSLADEGAVFGALHGLARHFRFDQVECLWEPYMVLAARIREALGLPGMTVEQTVPFRDKERMKQVLDAAGVRTPHHFAATTVAGVWEAAERIGYPIIVKPIAGAGSADTYRVDSAAQLAEVLPMLRHVPEVSVEEFIDGEEFTFDTVCADGEILFENVLLVPPAAAAEPAPRVDQPGVDRAARPVRCPSCRPGGRWARRCWRALGFRDGFTHMEWYRTADGEAVFGEIAARPPGARIVDLMNYACDADLLRRLGRGGAARAASRRRRRGSTTPAASSSGPRATAGSPTSRASTGCVAAYGGDVVHVDLLPVGAPRRDWRATVMGDGWIVVRHHDLQRVIEMTERFAADLHLYAG